MGGTALYRSLPRKILPRFSNGLRLVVQRTRCHAHARVRTHPTKRAGSCGSSGIYCRIKRHAPRQRHAAAFGQAYMQASPLVCVAPQDLDTSSLDRQPGICNI